MKAFGFDVDIEKLFSKTPLQDLHTLGKSLPAPKWERPVILAIDEFQRIKGNQETPLAKLLQSIHDADHIRLPLTLVLAGLSDTRECARKMGLTNTVNVCSVGRFTQEEQNEAVVGFCDHFGIDVGFQKDRLHTYFSVSDGWPRHIYWAQQALAEILITSEVEGRLKCIQDWASVENRRDFLRVAYYEDITSFEMESSRKILGAVMTFVENMEKNGTQLFLSDIEEILYRTFRNGESKPWKLPDGYNSQSYVRHLIHQGALQRDHITKSYVCPIPSFQSYLIEQADFTSEEWEELCEMWGNESKAS